MQRKEVIELLFEGWLFVEILLRHPSSLKNYGIFFLIVTYLIHLYYCYFFKHKMFRFIYFIRNEKVSGDEAQIETRKRIWFELRQHNITDWK